MTPPPVGGGESSESAGSAAGSGAGLAVLAALMYVMLVALACLPIVLRPDSPLSAVMAMLLTLPWSIVWALLIHWLAPELSTRVACTLVTIALAAAPNSLLIVKFVARLARRSQGRASGASGVGDPNETNVSRL